MSDVYLISKKILELFAENELSRAQSMFALKAAELSIHEDITRDIIDDARKGHETNYSGVM